jgi:hypothetical protein
MHIPAEQTFSGSRNAIRLITLWTFLIFGQKRRATSAGLPSASVRLEGVLVAVWWFVVLGACAYGFMLGMGG